MPAGAVVDDVLDPILEWFREFESYVPGVFGRVLGWLIDIPHAKELGMYDLADAYGHAMQVLDEHCGRLSSLSQPIAEAWSGGSAADYGQTYAEYVNQVNNTVQSLGEMRDLVRSAGLEIEMTKFMAAVNLYMLADAIFSILATAWLTFGLSTIAAPAAEATCEAGIKAAARDLVGKLLSKKFTAELGNFAKLLGDKALPAALKPAATDALTTGAADAGEALLTDASADALTDAGADALTDAGADALTDAGADALTDAGADALTDAGA
ncbi:WXG100 family type VII secretion target, partial [Rugosimonospora acidiphila]|uniref:WXG100 family type VII secretion target n=1 Tax=Rugosimonospora acidiphila TaxID=556531 RepID=UPI003CD0BD6C